MKIRPAGAELSHEPGQTECGQICRI